MVYIALMFQLCGQHLVQSLHSIRRKEPNLYVHGTPTYINVEEEKARMLGMRKVVKSGIISCGVVTGFVRLAASAGRASSLQYAVACI